MEIISVIVFFLQILLLSKMRRTDRGLQEIKQQLEEIKLKTREQETKTQEVTGDKEELCKGEVSHTGSGLLLDTVEKEKLLDAVLYEVFT